jgi:hypothetical protein
VQRTITYALTAVVMLACGGRSLSSGPSSDAGTGSGKKGNTGDEAGSGGASTAHGVQNAASGGTDVSAGAPSAGGPASSGGTASSGGAGGGSSGSGGRGAAGGRRASGGAGGQLTAGSGGSVVDCSMGQKLCGGACYLPSPLTGCGLTGCDACATLPPDNGFVTCTNYQCDFGCFSGYTKSRNECVLEADASIGCTPGEKLCGGICTPPAPRNGCGMTGCDACTLQPPSNGYITCSNNQCVFDCLSGFTRSGNACVGSSADAGGNGNCRPQSCPQTCSAVFGPACCTSEGKCGCPAVPWVAPTCIAN